MRIALLDLGLWVVVGLAAVESAACGGNGCSVFFSLGQLLLLSF